MALFRQSLTRASIKEQIEALEKENRDTLFDLRTTAPELRAQVTEQLLKAQKVLHELAIYAWIIRIVFVLEIGALGGSIYGLVKIQDYLDSRISVRLIKSDRMNLGLSQANSGQYREALVQFSQLFSDYKTHTFTPSTEYRSFLFMNLTWVISQVEQLQPDGSWIGEKEWIDLNSDDDFRREFLTSGNWDNDEYFNNYMAFCTLKFDKSPNALSSATAYFRKSLESSSPELRKAPHFFALAMTDVIVGRDNEALDKWRQAEVINPAEYRVTDLARNTRTYENSTEFKIWIAVAKRNGVDFVERYHAFLDKVRSQSSTP